MVRLSQMTAALQSYLDARGDKDITSIGSMQGARGLEYQIHLHDVYEGPAGGNPYSGKDVINIPKNTAITKGGSGKMTKTENTSALAKQIAEAMNLDQAESLMLYKELAEIQDGCIKGILTNLLPVIKMFGSRRCLNILAGDNTVVKDLMKNMGSVDFSKNTADVDFSKLYPKNYEELVEFFKKDQKRESGTKYVACIRADCVRDAQHSKWEKASPMDDHAWVWANDMPLFLEIVVADSPTRAVQLAAARAGVSENIIELIPV